MLAAGENRSAVAKSLKCDRKTLYRWLQRPGVLEEIRQRANDMRTEFLDARRKRIKTAWDTIDRIMGDVDHPASALRAAVICVLKPEGQLIEVPRPKREGEIEKLEIGTLRAVNGRIVVEDPAPVAQLPAQEAKTK